ncbi:MAG: hypothetical protein ACKVOH_04335 [Chlamydiales bacterium]
MQRRILFSFLLFFTALAAFSYAAFAKGKQKAPEQEQLLIVINAKLGIFTLKRDSKTEGTLTLMDVAKSVSYFTEMPTQRGGSTPLSLFLKKWAEEKKEDTTASIIFTIPSAGKHLNMDLSISAPKYDAVHGLLSFHVKFPKKEHSIPLEAFKEPVLYIDDGSLYNRLN